MGGGRQAQIYKETIAKSSSRLSMDIYDLRHRWAVRSIETNVNKPLSASMGHTLQSTSGDIADEEDRPQSRHGEAHPSPQHLENRTLRIHSWTCDDHPSAARTAQVGSHFCTSNQATRGHRLDGAGVWQMICGWRCQKPKVPTLFQVADVDTGVINWVNADLVTHIVPPGVRRRARNPLVLSPKALQWCRRRFKND